MKPGFDEYLRTVGLGIFAGIILAAVFTAGFFARDIVNVPSLVIDSEKSFPLLDEVQLLIERHYLRDLPEYSQQQYAAIRGMLATLNDPNTFFIEPPVAQSESDALAGTYGGIGVQIRRSEFGDFILTPFEDSPAQRAGIEDGDVLQQINGQEINITMQQDAVDQMMRGEVKPGNGVELTVQKADGETLTVFIEYDVIYVPSVLWRVLDEHPELGYIQIIRFTNRTPDELRQGLTELRNLGIRGLILDLRNNGGGLLNESLDVADEFLDGGVVVYERTNQSQTAYEVDPGGLMVDLPLVTLVNGGTASASELVAGAIQSRDRGILIGQQTFGKGTIQQIFALSDRSSIHITSAEWLTPDQETLNGKGLEPTITMIPDENGRDVEIGEAVRYLQQELATQESSS